MSEDYIEYNYQRPAAKPNKTAKSKQTAVEWLVSQLNIQGFAEVVTDEEIQKAKEIEKQQIIDAVDGFPIHARNLNGEDYYIKIFGGNK